MPNPYAPKTGEGFTRAVGNVRQFPRRNRSRTPSLPFVGKGGAGLPLRDDVQQSLYLAGYNGQLRKMNQLGELIWEVTSAAGVGTQRGHVDPWGNCVLQTSSDVKKYSQNGQLLWTYTDATGGLNTLAIDSKGFIYCGGSGQSLRKLSPNGVSMWTLSTASSAIYSIAVGNGDFVYCLTADGTLRKVDHLGRLIKSLATGLTTAITGVPMVLGVDDHLYLLSNTGVLKKYRSDLVEMASVTINVSPVNSSSVTVHWDGSIYVSISEVLMKLDRGFNEVWRYTNAASLYANTCQVDFNGNVYLATTGNGERVVFLNAQGKLRRSITVTGNTYDNLCALTPGQCGTRVKRKRFLGQ